MDIKAIETSYKGYKFRSRLEARWAVFFDAMGFEYQYEPEGFHLNNRLKYLPDFWLPWVEMYAEVKPTQLKGKDREKVIALVLATGKPCLQLIGPPDFRPYWAIEAAEDGSPPSVVEYDYAIISKNYLGEHRFWSFCAGTHETEDQFGQDYRDAVYASRQARFEHGEKPLLEVIDQLESVVKQLGYSLIKE